MDIIIQSVHFTAKQELKDFINEKAGKLSHFHDKIETVNVSLKIEKAEDGTDKVCEILLAIPGDNLFVKKHAATFEEATSKAVDVLQEQIKKAKTKVH